MRRLIDRLEYLQARARARGRLTRAEAQELTALLREIQSWTRLTARNGIRFCDITKIGNVSPQSSRRRPG